MKQTNYEKHIKSVIFNTDEVRATQDGRKTMMRQVVKPQPEMHMFGDREALAWLPPAIIRGYLAVGVEYTEYLKKPYRPGDILYVRETWNYGYVYRADAKPGDLQIAWRPSIHMPRKAARIFLRVTDVRVERLQEIDDNDAIAEGVNFRVGVYDKMARSAIHRFHEIWNSNIKPADLDKYGWAANPWVWAIAFERCKKPEGF